MDMKHQSSMADQSDALVQFLQLLAQQGLSADSGIRDAAADGGRAEWLDTLRWDGLLDFDIITETYEADVETRRPFDPPGLAPDYERFSLNTP